MDKIEGNGFLLGIETIHSPNSLNFWQSLVFDNDSNIYNVKLIVVTDPSKKKMEESNLKRVIETYCG